MSQVHRLEVPLQGVAATHIPGAAEIWSGLDDRSRVLYAAVVASLLLHALLFSLHFRFPEQLRWKSDAQALDVILVNARSYQRPARTQALAQVDLDGGGGDLAQAERRRRELEAEQRRLFAQSHRPAPAVAGGGARRDPSETPAPRPDGRDLADLSLAAMRLQAEVDRNLEAYQKRPRKKFIGASAVEYRFAQYEEDWRRKIERVGTVNYPAAARGRLYGNLRMTVTLRSDGNVESVELDRSSGLKVLDDAAFRIVKMASPYAAFPPAIRRDTDLLVITRTWFFGRGDRLWTE